MKRFLPILATLILFAFTVSDTTKHTFTKKTQLALCVDFSKSAHNVLMAFKRNYWKLFVQHHSKHPDTKLELAIVGYSSNAFGKKGGYVKILSKFGDDPEPLFHYMHSKASSSNSKNNIGSVVHLAASSLNWDRDPSVEKNIVVIGNGPILDKKSTAEKASKIALEKGIKINALYLLYKDKDKFLARWRKMMDMSGGKVQVMVSKYLNENLNSDMQSNNKIAKDANKLLNSTYLWYGKTGREKYEYMLEVDSFAKVSGEACYESRMMYKATPYFQGKHGAWDLIDLHNDGKFSSNVIDRKNIYGKLGNFSLDKIEKVIKSKSEERKHYLEIISVLNNRNTTIRDTTEKDQPGYKKYLSKSIMSFVNPK